MKRNLIFAVIAVLALSLTGCSGNKKNNNTTPQSADATHTSRNAIDYEGTYTGTIPCADCPGIHVELTLKGDDFTLKTNYEGRAEGENRFTETGKFSWNAAGTIITLNNDNTRQYQVGENRLFMLDEGGQRITGEFADMYVLTKN